ncbi:hypothetical protein BDB01DRAFT_848002 [Pilobolus umbonatus]|nr:hypothetical protein BDB01DRAFT_848002 [Pilobolus umbonatus]
MSNMEHGHMTTPVTAAQLKIFLAEAPLMYSYKLTEDAEKHIITNCYRSLWSNNSDYLERYFFGRENADSDNLLLLLEQHNVFGKKGKENDVDYKPDEQSENWENQQGKQCGHLFKKGESVYRCRNCGLDETCVMCSACFRATNHEGHDVKLWISKGNGGCCDCGDPEAWKIPLQCRIHSIPHDSDSSSPNATQSLEPLSTVPDKLISSIRETFTVILNYVLETFAACPEDLDTIGDAETITEHTLQLHEALGLPFNKETQKYVCVLWNDESHSFDEVIRVVKRATGCSTADAMFAAESVDVHGRYIIKESEDIPSLIKMASIISSIKLTVTISSSERATREEIAGLLLGWLTNLVSGTFNFFNTVQGGNTIVRDIICQVLAEDWALVSDLAWLSTKFRRGRNSGDINDRDSEDDEEEENDMVFGSEDEFVEDDEQVEMIDIDDIEEEIYHTEDEEHSEDEHHENEHHGDDDHNTSEGGHDALDVYFGEEHLDHFPEAAAVGSSASSPPMRVYHLETSTTDIRPAESSNPPSYIQQSSESHTDDALKRRRLSVSSHHKPHKSHKHRDILDLEYNLDSWIDHIEKLEQQEVEIAQKLGLPYSRYSLKHSQQINNHLKKEFNRKLRLDYFLQFDLRLWKTARIHFKDLLIGTFISNFEYRPILGIRYARNYPELVDAYYFKDREPEVSVNTLSVQVLTVPTVSSLLVKEYRLFGIICSILTSFFLTDHICLILPDEYNHAQIDCFSRAIKRRRYVYTVFDLNYMLNSELVKTEITKSPLYLRHFIDMIYQFQAMDPIQHQSKIHVEYESQSWADAFNLTLQVSKLCRLFAKCFDASVAKIEYGKASLNLCRSIYRVLKAMAEWDPHSSIKKMLHELLGNNKCVITGLVKQKFHQIATPNAGVFNIVDYNINQDPISFHHPYHWLLSDLFEHISLLQDDLLYELGWKGGFKEMIHKAFRHSENDTFLMLLDYPIRTLAALNQINCGVWVRNGLGIRIQSQSYRDVNMRENTLDREIFLLQVGFVVCNADQLLLTIIDRFQLNEWFKGKYYKSHPVYDDRKIKFMIEEFLNLIIICVTEHGFASGVSNEDRIRQYIIQYLGISSLSYSELLNFIPDSLAEDESFETLLNEIANFKAPDGLNDKGLYEIKPEFIDEIDPYFWYYNRNQREESHAVLKKNWNRQNPDKIVKDTEEFLIIPKNKSIAFGPFKQLGNFLHAPVLCQILIYSIWNTKMSEDSKNHNILDEALYLAMIAVTDQNSAASNFASFMRKGKYREGMVIDSIAPDNFINHAVNDQYAIQVNEIEKDHATLLIVFLRCLDDPNLNHIYKRLNYIVDQIEKRGPVQAADIILDWRDRRERLRGSIAAIKQDETMSDMERKKATAKARQAEIMSQFANAQNMFMEKHADLYEDEDLHGDSEMDEVDNNITCTLNDTDISDSDVEIVRKCHFPADTCIVCQEDLKDNKLYGMLGFIQKSNLQKHTVWDNKTAISDILTSSSYEDPWTSEKGTDGTELPFTGYPVEAHNSSLNISSCGHLMHAECFETYQESVNNQSRSFTGLFAQALIAPKNILLCPLCKTLGNVLVPIVWVGKKEAYPGIMAPKTPYADLKQSLSELIENLAKTLQIMPGQFESTKSFNINDPNLVIGDETKLKFLYNQLMKAMALVMTGRNDNALELHNCVNNLHKMYANTIADLEVSQRGKEDNKSRDLTVEHTGTFIDNVSTTSQILLKILGMTNTLIPLFMDSNWQSSERHVAERLALDAAQQFLPKHTIKSPTSMPPLLMDDPFESLVKLSFSVGEVPSVDVHHIMRSLFLAAITRIIIVFINHISDVETMLQDSSIQKRLQRLNKDQKFETDGHNIEQLAFSISRIVNVDSSKVEHLFGIIRPNAFVALLRLFTLPYLRKSLLFMVVRHGFIPQEPTDEMMEGSSKYEQLLSTLRLPSLESMFILEEPEKQLMMDWCEDYVTYTRAGTHSPIYLSLPTEFRLVSLPYRLDSLLDESLKRVCRKCKTVPEHSALCLICGTFVCARRSCCTEDMKGECNIHMQSCGGEVGIYLMIKDCFLLLLHDNGGSIMNAPYLDSHGEADIFFKRGAPQFLNEKRYEQIRQMYISQSIPSYVRRKMEATNTSTRWEAF